MISTATRGKRISERAAIRLPARLVALAGRPLRMVVVPILFVVAWHFAARVLADPTVLPLPLRVGQAFFESARDPELWKSIFSTLRRVSIAYAISVGVGVPLGILMGASPTLQHVFDPALEVLRPIPGLAVLPLLLILIGLGDKLIVSVVVYAAFFPIVINTTAAVRGVNRLYEQVALTMGVSRWAIFREVIFPAALPGILIGMRIGLAFAWMSIIGAEFVGTLQGIGYLITWYQRLFVVDHVIMMMIIIGVLGFLLDRGLRLLRQWLLPWAVETGIEAE